MNTNATDRQEECRAHAAEPGEPRLEPRRATRGPGALAGGARRRLRPQAAGAQRPAAGEQDSKGFKHHDCHYDGDEI